VAGQRGGALIQMYRELTHLDSAPDSAELLLTSAATLLAGILLWQRGVIMLGARGAAAVVLANVAHDLYRHLLCDAARPQADGVTHVTDRLDSCGWLP
jgi:hypothetical protein